MSFFENISKVAQQLGSELKDSVFAKEHHSQNHGDASTSLFSGAANRYSSFAPRREGNDVKWFVDGCGYFWAVSEALEQAKDSIWILDCMYLHRPGIQKAHNMAQAPRRGVNP